MFADFMDILCLFFLSGKRRLHHHQEWETTLSDFPGESQKFTGVGLVRDEKRMIPS